MWALEEGELGRMEVQIERPAWESMDVPRLNYVLPWASPELQGVYSALFSKRLWHHTLIRVLSLSPSLSLSLSLTHTHTHTHELWKLSLFFYKYALSVSLELPPPLQQLRASPRCQASTSLRGCTYPLQNPHNMESQRYCLCKHNFL